MSSTPLSILIVCGSNNEDSATRVAVLEAGSRLQSGGCEVDGLDLHETQLPLLNPATYRNESYLAPLRSRVLQADVFVLGTPDYHGGISGAMKNFLDHFWKEFAGKLFATIVASHEKGLTVHDQLRTVARQCYAWTLPYGLSLKEDVDIKEGRIVGEAFARRIEMFVHDILTYGRLLADQRRADLTGEKPGFLARHRAPSRS